MILAAFFGAGHQAVTICSVSRRTRPQKLRMRRTRSDEMYGCTYRSGCLPVGVKAWGSPQETARPKAEPSVHEGEPELEHEEAHLTGVFLPGSTFRESVPCRFHAPWFLPPVFSHQRLKGRKRSMRPAGRRRLSQVFRVADGDVGFCAVARKKQWSPGQVTAVDVTGAVFLLGGVTFIMSLFYLVSLC